MKEKLKGLKFECCNLGLPVDSFRDVKKLKRAAIR